MVRHPSVSRLVESFKVCGFDVDAHASVTHLKKSKYDFIYEVEERDNSTLAILNQDLFDDGLQRIYDLEETEIADEVAVVTVTARRCE